MRRVERAIFYDGRFVTAARLEHAWHLATRPHGAKVMLATARDLGNIRGVRQRWRDELLAGVAARALPTLVVWGDRDLILPAVHLEAARARLPLAGSGEPLAVAL